MRDRSKGGPLFELRRSMDTIEVKHSLKPLLMESRYDMYNLHIMLSFFTLDISKKLVHITQYI